MAHRIGISAETCPGLVIGLSSFDNQVTVDRHSGCRLDQTLKYPSLKIQALA